ncbi:PA2778 family cysteine peptidase [Sulfurisoma sediminicola]|uniref:PA2778 family cysteine peptidase n=1 Tax=Sulfurisoma sediminicola TaxID=1381557 RepID=UPI001A9DD50B|nr:PA2778 family cysteine peptidase [Sulfurisoma sediminicola]
MAAALLSGCAGLPQVDAVRAARDRDQLPRRVELADVPFFPQQEHHCGPAALATVLVASGTAITPEALAEQVYLPGREGSLQVEMLAAARRNGHIAWQLAPSLVDVLREVAAGNPVIVLLNVGLRPMPFWHYAVVIGYDLDKGEVLLRSGDQRRKRVPFAPFDFFWRDSKYWAMLAMPPPRLPATANEAGYGTAVVAVERLGYAAEARQAYEAMLARWPESYLALMGLGNSLHASGRLAAAADAFRRASLAKPTDAAAFNNLAQTLADLGQWREALEPARQAVALGGPLLETSQSTLSAIEREVARLPANKVRKSSKKGEKKARNP